MNYTIYRNTYPIHICRPTGQQERAIMEKDLVSFSFSSPDPVQLQIGDYIDVWGSRYELQVAANVTKDSTQQYVYECAFVAEYYKLSKWNMLGYDATNTLSLPEWELQGSLTDFLEIAVANANRKSTGWVVGDVDPATAGIMKYLTFTQENNILLSLSQIAAAFDTEWWVVGRTIHFTKRQEVSGHSFEYGYDMGLRGGLRKTASDTSNVFSQLFVQGSEQNIPASYRSGQRRLQLPTGTDYLQGTKWGQDEIERWITFDDIRPERIGTVTASTGTLSFTDSGIDFDLNAPGTLLPGVSAKVSFLTGNLSGYNFEIAKGGYDHATRTVRIVTNEQEKGNILPDDTRRPEVGDTYFFFDIVMPDSYVTSAESRLLAAGTAHLFKNGSPKFAFEVPPDHFFFTRNSTLLTLGDTVHVKDLDLGLDNDIRITAYTRSLHNEFEYTSMSLSDFVTTPAIVRQYAAAEITKKALEAGKVYDIKRARNNWRTTAELSTLLDTVRAEMLLIVTDGGSYTTTITATLTTTDFTTTGGQLTQEQYLGDTNGIWTVAPFTGSVTGGAKFVYIRASKTANTANIILSDTKIGVESVSGVYHFPLGIISSVIDSARTFTRLFGRTSITGGQVATGEIVSNSGDSRINLDDGTFSFENTLASIKFTDAGVILEGTIIATSAEFINLIVQNLRTANVGEKRVVIDADQNNIRLYNAANQVLLEVDDDAAVEGFGDAIPAMGPGLRVGLHDGNRATVSNRGFYVVNGTTGEKSYVASDRIVTEGDLLVGGDVTFIGSMKSGSDTGATSNIDAGGAHMRFVNGLYVGVW